MAFLQPKKQTGLKSGGFFGVQRSQSQQTPETDLNPNIDLSIRRKSDNSQTNSNEGTPFIIPQSQDEKINYKNQRKNFFRPPQKNPQTQPANLGSIAHLSNEQKIRIATLLHLNPATPENLTFFLQQSNTKNPQIVHALALIIEKVLKGDDNSLQYPQSYTPSPDQSPFNSPQNMNFAATPNAQVAQGMAFIGNRPKREHSPPISSFEFNDVRYTHYPDETIIMKKPLLLGAAPVEATYHIPQLEEDAHVIIQCYIAGVAPSPIGWPATLRVLVNGKIIKGQGICRFPALDVTNFIPDCDITIISSQEMHHYFLIIRPCYFKSFSQIVHSIQENPPQQEPEIDASISVYDPLSGDLMKYPGRGIHCRHCQCFDLKEYIKRATLCRRWVCPICSTLCELKDLVFSHQMKQYITDGVQPTLVEGTPEEFQYDAQNAYDEDDYFNF